MRRVAFAVPGDLATPTGGYLYDQRITAELVRAGWDVELINLGEGFPWPTAERRAAARDSLRAVPSGRPIVVDGLAFGAIPELAAELAPRHPLIALVHHPLALETGLCAAKAEELRVSECAALATAKRIVVTSATTARRLVADYAVLAERIAVVRPGADPALAATGSDDGVVRILSVGAVTPRKGYDLLVASLATMADLNWRLTIVGDHNRDPEAVKRLEADIQMHRLSDRVAMLGAVSRQRVAELFAGADLFALASHYEGYGMAYAEAIAHGLPIIGTRAGAIPETVPARAGLLVATGDIAALSLALRRIIESPLDRLAMAAAAREAARALPRWPVSGRLFSEALEAALR